MTAELAIDIIGAIALLTAVVVCAAIIEGDDEHSSPDQ